MVEKSKYQLSRRLNNNITDTAIIEDSSNTVVNARSGVRLHRDRTFAH